MAAVKPQLRGLLHKQIKRDMVMTAIVSLTGGAMWWFLVALPKRRAYDNFYKNYDAEAVAATMTPSWEEEN